MKHKYFLTDLDGTLLKNDSSLSDYTIKTIKTALTEGAVISYATARSYTSSYSVTSMIPWEYPLVLYNGALIVDPMTKEVIAGSWLKEDITNAIIDEGKNHKLTPLLFGLDKNNEERVLHEKSLGPGYIQFVNARKNDPRFTPVDRLYCPSEYRTLYITYIGTMKELEPFKNSLVNLFKDKIAVHIIEHNHIENYYFIELTHSKGDKEEGLIQWCKLVGCTPDEVTVFGDDLNDLGMFRKAGKKVAVGNANPELIAHADEVIGNNEEDSVARYISKRFICMEQ